jgi:peptidoglycan/LPS O-acetylase OafA/YrhL
MSWAPLRWLGNMSYSYYLIHGLTLKFVFLVVGIIVPKDFDMAASMLLPAFAVTLVPSALLFLLVERPVSLQSSKERANPAAPVASRDRAFP